MTEETPTHALMDGLSDGLNDEPRGHGAQRSGRGVRRAGSALAVALGLALLGSSLYTVDESERAIVTRFGRPLPEIAGPGLHLKAPWPIDALVRLDARLLLFDGEPTEMLTADKKNVVVDSFVCWRIADPLRFAQTVRTRAEAEARLLDLSASELGATVGRTPMESFLQIAANDPKAPAPQRVALSEISERTARALDAATRASFGIEVVDLQINGFTLPAQNRESVIERMRAERARIATRYRSEGERQALEIRAQANVEREAILSEAKGKAEAIRGRGEAEALRLFADAYSADPALYRYLRSLESYEKILDRETTIFLRADSPLLDALDGR